MLAINRITKYGFEKLQVWTFFLKTKGLTHFLKAIWYALSEKPMFAN